MAEDTPQASVISSIFLQSNPLYASLDRNAAEIPKRQRMQRSTRARRDEDVHVHIGSSQNPFVGDSLALLDKSRYAASEASRSIRQSSSPPQPHSARSLLGMLNPHSKHYTALQNDLFEQEEEVEDEEQAAFERGRQTTSRGRTTPTPRDQRSLKRMPTDNREAYHDDDDESRGPPQSM